MRMFAEQPATLGSHSFISSGVVPVSDFFFLNQYWSLSSKSLYFNGSATSNLLNANLLCRGNAALFIASVPVFLNLDTVDTVGGIIHCCGEVSSAL